MGGRVAGLAAVNLAAVILGSAALFGRIDASPVWIVAGRTAFAAVVLGGLMLARRQPIRLDRTRLGQVLLTAVMLGAHWTLFFISVQLAGVAVAAVTVSTFPLFTVVLAAASSRRAPSAVELLAGAAVVVAVGLIVGPGAPAAAAIWPGALAGLAAALLFAFFALASQPLLAAMGQLPLSFLQYLAIAVLLSPALPFTRPVHGAAGWAALVVLGVGLTALGHQLYLYALRRLPASVCGAIVSLEPVYAIGLAALVFHDPLRPAAALSALVIVAAAWLLLRDADRRAAPVP